MKNCVMSKLLDRQLRKNDCGISAVKTVCNILNIDIDRRVIEGDIRLSEEGSSLNSLNKFFNDYGFDTAFKLIDLNSINGNQEELNKLFPCIVPVKGKKSLHYIVISGLKKYKFKVLDPAKKRPYELSVNELKSKALYNSSAVKYVEVEESIKFQINKSLNEYGVKLPYEPSEKQLVEIFNKLAYFGYVDENFGFKDKTAGQNFLKDLLFHQELKHIPKHFEEIIYDKNKLRLKAPVFLSIKKTQETKEVKSSKSENVYWTLFKTIGSIKTLWYIFLFTMILASMISYVSVFINQILIDHILPTYQLNMLRVFTMGVAIFFLVELSFSIYRKYVSIHLSIAFDRYFMKVFDDKLTNFSIQYLQSYRRGDLTERLRDSLKLKSFFTRHFTRVVVDVMIASTSMFFLFLINWKLSMLVLIVLFLFTILFYVFTPIIENLERQRYSKKADFMSKFIEKIEGIQTIKAMGLEKHSSSQIHAGIEDLILVQTKSKYVGLINSVLTKIITTFASLAILVLTAREMIVFNTITLGMIITFLALSNKIFKAFGKLLEKNLVIQEHKVILKRFLSFDESSYGITQNEQIINAQELNSREKNSQNLLRDFEFNQLKVKNVSFSYNNEKNILNDVDLEIDKLDKILIQGKNGSGKSTLCKILGLLYEPSGGEILLNDIHSNLYHRKELRKKIVFVSGEDILFNEPLIFNIAFDRPIDMATLIRYCKELELYDFIIKKPGGFDFMIYENGKNLSTGQRKKVLLLRALMTTSDLIILDEIFNGMDKESKAKAEALINNINDRTFIIVSHMQAKGIKFNKTFEIKNGLLFNKNTE